MGTMIGSWKPRKFRGETYYHYGNSDHLYEAKAQADFLRKGEISVKITGDRHTGANIWVRKKKKACGSIKEILSILETSYVEKMERMREVKF